MPFDQHANIRKVIYTTHFIESLNSVIRKYFETRKGTATDDTAFKFS
jgi:transposase-like protein